MGQHPNYIGLTTFPIGGHPIEFGDRHWMAGLGGALWVTGLLALSRVESEELEHGGRHARCRDRGNMTPKDIRGLARATCAWLAFKHITGFDDTLGEAMLAIPISEYLRTRARLHSEVLYEDLGLPGLPQFSCDFAGTTIYGKDYRFVLETKYLKSKAYARSRDIIADLVRLSLSPSDTLKRYFLLAGDHSHFVQGDDEFLASCNLFGLKQGGGKYFQPHKQIQEASFQKKFPQYARLLSQEWSALPEYAYLQLGADEKILINDEQFFQVMIWSVGRSERAAKEALSDQE